MIQRIQTIYLFLIVILSSALPFFLKLWNFSEKKVYAFDLLVDDAVLAKLVPLLLCVSALIALIAIFQFKKRKLQFVLGRIIILINLFLLGILIFLSLNIPGEASSEKGIGMFIPFFVILLSVISNKAIKKDEDLVKSVDRLR